jgi:hypothetical protein
MAEVVFDYSKVLAKVARIIQTRIERQAPVRSGKLRDSISVRVVDNAIQIGYEKYGVYTNYGTGRYYKGGYGEALDPGKYKSYRKGKKGIRPQYWTSMSDADYEKVTALIELETDKQIQKALDEVFNSRI